jgi:5-methyltetrahydrofolate--homocysteine methyltransferase
LIDRIDYELSCRVFLGDAFPFFNMDCFGPGVAAAFLGARLDNSSGRVWFYPPENRSIKELHFEFDPENIWFQRIKAIYKAAMERWQGSVLMGMTDLGGSMDILSTFRPSEQLLLDLYDEPDEVERLLWECHEIWHRYYAELNAVLQPVNPGHSDWGAIYSETPTYMLQCDFSYMISPKMFRNLIIPELEASSKRLPHSFYHLDGIGQIPHLNALLHIEELDGVQWVHGAGKPDSGNWPEVFQTIHQGKKLIQVISGDFPALEKIQSQIGTLKGVHYLGFLWSDLSMQVEAWLRSELARFGIE